MCPAATPNTDSLPFAIDVNGKFVPYLGYEGDAATLGATGAISMPAPAADNSCAGSRSSPAALGSCHTVIYTPLAPCTPIAYPSGATTQGWAGIVWQHPSGNWGTSPGYLIPPGATKLSFWAKGAAGGEALSFFVGGTGYGAAPTASAPCADPVSASIKATLTTTWTQYTIPLGGTYGTGVLTGFGFSLAANAQPGYVAPKGGPPVCSAADAGTIDAGSGGPSTTFYIDDIEWQM
jgi:hypothetical protein